MVLNRPLAMALFIVFVCVAGIGLARVLEAPSLAAGLVATIAGPGTVVVLFEALRALDRERDPRARRAALLALVLMLTIPITAILAFARVLGFVAAPWSDSRNAL